MANLDEEFARFLGEVKSVEEAVAAAAEAPLGLVPQQVRHRIHLCTSCHLHTEQQIQGQYATATCMPLLDGMSAGWHLEAAIIGLLQCSILCTRCCTSLSGGTIAGSSSCTSGRSRSPATCIRPIAPAMRAALPPLSCHLQHHQHHLMQILMHSSSSSSSSSSNSLLTWMQLWPEALVSFQPRHSSHTHCATGDHSHKSFLLV